MPEEKKIVFYDPNGEGLHGKGIMLNLRRLVVDKFKRGGNSSQEAIDKFGKSWILADVSKNCPKQENGESVRHICVFGCAPAPLTSPLTNKLDCCTAYDCGIFTFLLMALHSQGIEMDFGQERVYRCWGGRGVRGQIVHLMTMLNDNESNYIFNQLK